MSVCVVASVVGYVIPWIMHKFGFDPAAASDPLITTVRDVTALLIYFGLALILLTELLCSDASRPTNYSGKTP